MLSDPFNCLGRGWSVIIANNFTSFLTWMFSVFFAVGAPSWVQDHEDACLRTYPPLAGYS